MIININKPKLLRITLNGEEHPNYTFSKGMESSFDCKTIWWENHPPHVLDRIVRDELNNNRYDAVFMQIQRGGIIDANLAQFMSSHCPVYNWTGDVRSNIDWFIDIGRYVTTLFTNEHDVGLMQMMNLKADYLQVGYDHTIYNYRNLPRKRNIVFCANNYDNLFPLSGFRRYIVAALQAEFGNMFELYGEGWGLIRSYGKADNNKEAELYNTAGIVISQSHFNYTSYFSDRLLRALACGAKVITSDNIGNKDDVLWQHVMYYRDLDSMIKLCHSILESNELTGNPDAAKDVANNYTWYHFAEKFRQIWENGKNSA